MVDGVGIAHVHRRHGFVARQFCVQEREIGFEADDAKLRRAELADEAGTGFCRGVCVEDHDRRVAQLSDSAMRTLRQPLRNLGSVFHVKQREFLLRKA